MSSIKGFLCSFDGTYTFPLLPKVTTIGRENCDIIINSANIDTQHAVIEFLDSENCYVLQDLNTVNGTYINDCRVQNAAVRLAEHDIIRFGFNGIPFQFVVQEQTTIMPSLTSTKPSNSQQLQLINQTIPSLGSQYQTNNGSIWINIPAPNAQLMTLTNPNQVAKPPASLRSRPLSAGTAKKVSREIQSSPKLNGWVKGYNSNGNTNVNSNELDNTKLGEAELHNKIYQLEKEMKTKNIEIKDLTDKLNSLQIQQNSFTGTAQTTEVTLKTELEQVKRDKSIATGLINTMQKDLMNKDATISKLAREIEGLKKESREKDLANRELSDKMNSMKDFKKVEEERINKDKELLVLKNKIRTTDNKVVELNNQVLQIRAELEESQRQVLKTSQTEKSLKDELEHVKLQYLDMQRAERLARVDLGELRCMHEKFRNGIIQSLYSTPGVSQPTGEVKNEELIALWKKVVEERTKYKEKVESLKEELKTSSQYHTETIEGLGKLENEAITIEARLKQQGRRLNVIKESLQDLEKVEVHDTLIKLKDTILEIYRNELNWQTEIENTLNSLGIETNNNYSVTVLLKSIQDKVTLLEEQKEAVEKSLKEAETLYSETIINLTQQHEVDCQNKVESAKAELTEHYNNEIAKIKSEHEQSLNQIQDNSQMSRDEIAQQLNNVTSQLAEANSQINSLKESLEISNQSISLLKDQLNDANQESKSKIEELENQNLQASSKYSQDLEIYKEQIRQHSLTIVGLERDLNRARDREIEFLNQIENLKKKNQEPARKASPPPPPPPQPVVRVDTDILALEKTIDNLRNECSSYSRKVSEQDEIIRVLRRDLISANAKLTDVQSEMTDKQKRELEKNRSLLHEQSKELAENRAQLSKLSEIVDNQTKQIDSLKIELSKSRALIDKYKSSAEENGNLVIELKSKLDSGNMQLKKFESIRHEEGKITSELTAIGAQCRGERHEQVITRQREALNELRQRVKTLEQSRPVLPSQQQQMQQQIMLLKKQLAEFRANQALTEDIAKQANLARGGDEGLLMIEEKTAHYETQSALDYSEETYLNLLRSIASMLDLNHIEGLRSMTNLPVDEREKLLNERNKSIEKICVHLKEMKESLMRKEKLLQEYELDLAKLRQTEFLLQKKAEQLDDAQVSSRNKDDEIEFLKEALRNARTQLDQEKIITNAMKQKRPISSSLSLDKVRKNSTDTLHHHCPPDDEAKMKTVKKSMNEKIKKKDYELKVLKNELKTKHDELSEISNRLKIAEKGQDLYS